MSTWIPVTDYIRNKFPTWVNMNVSHSVIFNLDGPRPYAIVRMNGDDLTTYNPEEIKQLSEFVHKNRLKN